MPLKELIAESKKSDRKTPIVKDADIPFAEEARGQKSVMFYHWIGNHPSSEIIRVRGGQRQVAGDGQVMHVELLEAKFHNGMLQTSDPEIIALFRGKFGAPGSGITEDAEEYYSHVMTPEMAKRRTLVLNANLKAEVQQLREEKSRLVAQLEETGNQEKQE